MIWCGCLRQSNWPLSDLCLSTFTISLLRVWEHRLTTRSLPFQAATAETESVCLKCVQLPHAISWSYVYMFTHFIKIINYYISIFIIDVKLQSFIIMYSLLSTGFAKPHITWILQGQHNLNLNLAIRSVMKCFLYVKNEKYCLHGQHTEACPNPIISNIKWHLKVAFGGQFVCTFSTNFFHFWCHL